MRPTGNLRSDIVELTLKLNSNAAIDRLGAPLRVTLKAPSGGVHRVVGFFDGETWKARSWPDELGRWTYTYYVQVAQEPWQPAGDGVSDSVPAVTDSPVRSNVDNLFRWVMTSGAPFFPLGLQDCFRARGDQLPSGYTDGGPRATGQSRVVPIDKYFRIYGDAGFNLLWFSQNNCSYWLFDSYDTFRWPEMRATDQLLALAH